MFSILVIYFCGLGLVASQCTGGIPLTCDTIDDCPPTSLSCEGGSGVSDGSILGTCCPTVDTTTAASVTATTLRATTTSACVDRLNPRTGISDCPATAYLCNDSVYYDVMTYQCPRTCNRCGVATTAASTTCVDRTNPATGVSDCAARANLCNNSVYYDLMTQQCPRTCGRCTTTATVTSSTTTCVDQVNAVTGVSDCASRAYLCTNAAYASFMRTECPRTCGYCTSR